MGTMPIFRSTRYASPMTLPTSRTVSAERAGGERAGRLVVVVVPVEQVGELVVRRGDERGGLGSAARAPAGTVEARGGRSERDGHGEGGRRRGRRRGGGRRRHGGARHRRGGGACDGAGGRRRGRAAGDVGAAEAAASAATALAKRARPAVFLLCSTSVLSPASAAVTGSTSGSSLLCARWRILTPGRAAASWVKESSLNSTSEAVVMRPSSGSQTK